MTETATDVGRALSAGELVFARRMLPHYLNGKSAHEAAALVLEDDERLFQAFALQSSHCVHAIVEPRNEGIRSALAMHVYAALAAKGSGEA